MKYIALAFPLLLMACAAPVEVVEPLPLDNPAGPVESRQSSGLQERLPNTCGLEAYQGFVGQPSAAVIAQPGDTVRVVKPGEILPQVYDANRVNLYVDQAGIVQSIICG